jgi:hypothetical protein
VDLKEGWRDSSPLPPYLPKINRYFLSSLSFLEEWSKMGRKRKRRKMYPLFTS